jgi:hypothetical protein
MLMPSFNGSTPTSAADGNQENTMENKNPSMADDGEREKCMLERLNWIKSFGAQRINPDTAEVRYEYSQFLDPYGVSRRKYYKMMAHYFARSPGSDIWVAWGDLPYEVEESLWQKHRQTDPALREPTSCWASFVNSRYFRHHENMNTNLVRYVRQRAPSVSSKESKGSTGARAA